MNLRRNAPAGAGVLASWAASVVLAMTAAPARAQSDAPSPPPGALLPPSVAIRVPAARPSAPPPPLARPPRGGGQAARALPPGGGPAWSPVPAQPLVLFGAPGSGVTFATAGSDLFALTLRARVQLRETLVVPHGPASAVTNELNVRTMRLILAGHAFSRATQYVLQLALAPADFEPNTVSPIFDAWVAFNQLRDLQVRLGQFFVPFDRARTNAEWGLDLVDRSLLVGEASLDRDVGIEVSSNDVGGWGVLGYRLGVFGGEGKNRVASLPGFLYVARVQFAPFGVFDDNVEGDILRLPRPRVSLGLGAAFNHQAQRQRSTQGNTYTLGPFDYGHLAADLTFKWAGFYLLAEALYRRANTDRHDGTQMGMALTEYSRSVWGYLVHAGVMLTRRLEAAARWEQMFPIGATDPALITQLRSQGNAMALGLNWYQSGHGFKIQGDWTYLFGESLNRGRHQFRLQIQVSF